ncbi:MAG: capsular polysaccharide biosynthesis protein CapF [Acidaminococcaceae bacterium]
MKILVTGAKGFIGKNLISELRNRNYQDILEYDLDIKEELLDTYCSNAEFVFHLAGVNRPNMQSEFMQGNQGFTSVVLDALKRNGNNCPIMFASSIQAALNNPYGISKKAGEDLLFKYAKETGSKVFVYRFQNVFGKWSRPDYNSVVATFCNNIASGLPIQINTPDTLMNMIYIDDVVDEIINAMEGKGNIREDGYCYVEPVYAARVGDIARIIQTFKTMRNELSIPDMSNNFVKKLYSTYLSFLPVDKLSYPLKMNIDKRGSFTEIIRTSDCGQISVNISKPGIIKGNHWHKTKNEKFIIVAGNATINLRKLGSEEIITYYVSGEKLEVVDIPPGFTHNIANEGATDLVTIIWSNEAFNPTHPDTYYLEV